MDNTDTFVLNDEMMAVNQAEIFGGVGLTEQRLLASKLTRVTRAPGEIVIEQGEVGDTLYIIIKGRVTVSVRDKHMEWVVVAKLNAGEVFGEIAILRSIPRTARITTETACTFYTINAKDFLDVYQYFPRRARDNIQLFMAKRLQVTNAYKQSEL